MELLDEHIDLLIHAACGSYGWYVNDETLAPAGELLRAGYVKARMEDNCPNIVATARGVELLKRRNLIEDDTELGGFTRIRQPA